MLLSLMAVAVSSCCINRHVPEGKYFLNKNTVVIEDKNVEFSKSEVSSYITVSHLVVLRHRRQFR